MTKPLLLLSLAVPLVVAFGCGDDDGRAPGPDGGGADTMGCTPPPPPAGQCWSDDDCEAPRTCEGGFLCPCGEVCGAPDIPGTCLDTGGGCPVAARAGCCFEDADCPTGACHLADCRPMGEGVCKEPDPAGGCFSDGDCPSGQTCQGASVCPCMASCLVPDSPGTCS